MSCSVAEVPAGVAKRPAAASGSTGIPEEAGLNRFGPAIPVGPGSMPLLQLTTEVLERPAKRPAAASGWRDVPEAGHVAIYLSFLPCRFWNRLG